MASSGVFTIDEWEVTAKPDSNVTISLSTEAVDLSKADKANDSTPYKD